jgi:probable phosphoglycerate mutase
MELLLIRHALPERIETTDGSPADPPLSARRPRAGRADGALAGRGEDRRDLREPDAPRARDRRAARRRGRRGDRRSIRGFVEMDHLSDVYVPLEQLKAEDYPRWQEMVQRGGLYAGVDLERSAAPSSRRSSARSPQPGGASRSCVTAA